MSEPAKPLKILSQRDLTPDESLWLDIRADAIKQTPTRVGDTLARLVTLATALAGGSLGVLKDDVCTGWGRVGAAAFFFAALVAAILGSFPRAASLPTFPAADIRAAVHAAIGFKERCARCSLWLLASGLLVAVAGAAVRAACPLPK